jgi:low affinity Fe/Cu permease
MTKQPEKTNALEQASMTLTRWVGTPVSIVIHTVFFIGIFSLRFFGFTVDDILLILTTVVSLEAIYLSIFIQMSVNRNTESLEDVEEDIEEIHENVEEIQEDVVEIQEDVGEIHEDVEEIHEDVEEIQEGIEELDEDEPEQPVALRDDTSRDRSDERYRELLREIRALNKKVDSLAKQ